MEKEYKIPTYHNKGYVIMKGECSHIALIRARRMFPYTSFNNHRIKTLKNRIIMKEISIEEKAKRYDEALKYARIYYTNGDEDMKMMMKTCFPVLIAESKDESIRKTISNILLIDSDEIREILYANNVLMQDVYALLEKQDEHKKFRDSIQVGDKVTRNQDGMLVNLSQLKRIAKPNETKQREKKPDDKVEPRFKIGDWVVRGKTIAQILDIQEQYYIGIDTNGNDFTSSRFLSDDKIHLWTIQDAKDGDVLAALDYILVFKEFLKNDGGISYCHYDFGAGNPQFIWFEDKNWYFGKEAIVHPATKEQRDKLEKAMADAGYTFDFEKKELRKIEQKFAEWGEEDENRFNNLIFLVECSDENEPTKKGFIDFINRLKSTSHQKHWKPSDEQMEALKNAIHIKPFENPSDSPLWELYEQLKKLKD